ncbi:hypothetical protein DFH94DRAFT_795797 [Russula ochroleuca]|uniref:Transposase n=1 Tax=Russula ochroleuca TaxID=152965 RepID=A0A9P5JWW7_9AGAM|nr:hypothetical protein DFH94DRAFT_795797 [Russula ochroleuca]
MDTSKSSSECTPGTVSPHCYQWSVNRRGTRSRIHPFLDGQPCDDAGYDLPNDCSTPPREQCATDDYFPYSSRPEFELADFLFCKEQMGCKKISELMDIWAAFQQSTNSEGDPVEGPPFASTQDLYDKIDSTENGDVSWQAFSVQYDGDIPNNSAVPRWKTESYNTWFRNPLKIAEAQLGNIDFAHEIDFGLKRVFSSRADRCQYSDFMSGNWAWQQADVIAVDPETHRSMFVPLILGSDKTTISVATGHNEYYPLYLSIGNVQNHVQRAHQNAVSLLGFLAIPKADKEYDDTLDKPCITRCGDGHLQRVIYGLGPYIADYPEQVLLACVVSGWCPKCTARPTNLDDDPTAILRSHEHTNMVLKTFEDELSTPWQGYGIISDVRAFTSFFLRANIHHLLSPDLLHQVIKGTFKDHLVDWVGEYLETVHGKTRAKEILADIDLRHVVFPLFPGLCRFPEGCSFKQWTGDDSKALMKVYLPAIAGHVPARMVRAISAFLEFCYLTAIARFQQEHTIFIETEVRIDFSLPRQHSLFHYHSLIQQFGAPNGLCSSITESRHITAVKQPWHCSN